MITDTFENKKFSMDPTGFEDDVDEDELLKKRQEEDGRLPTIEEVPKNERVAETFQQISELGKFYGRDLIYKYFF